METEEKPLPSRGSPAGAGTLLRVSVVVAVIVLANIAAAWLSDRIEVQIWPQHMEIVDRVVLISIIAYIGLMATPFLPGVEIGLALMTVLGPKGILITYACTLVALSISFGIGRLIPGNLLIAFLRWLHLTRAAALLRDFDETAPEKRLQFLTRKFPARTLPALLKRRYLILAVLLNLPGNALIGGGGGIAMIAGISRIYSFPMYLLLISVAILPGPIIVLLSKTLA
ncbi:MAG TPA: hypothetical protein VLS27_05385 [Gammaproteobacteria bacterium]|nr:hypothetical protein [Gammaproteobacteria bacterium]